MMTISPPLMFFAFLSLFSFFIQVLLSICSLLTDPNPDDPLVPEIAQVIPPPCCLDPPEPLFFSVAAVGMKLSSACGQPRLVVAVARAHTEKRHLTPYGGRNMIAISGVAIASKVQNVTFSF